ncbi:MAG: Crp/Fnr family transcriptional regulator [Crocinitomicaceae bacterium]|jgi:CRP/FNR family transcriptional regulator, anaerobic regulatory protein|nr:Crp/Fnr family transcriptional regulator [Crocinitomicaceae bacterium]MDP4761498.1 Crp/Fnr family transcriptional regulator [Crocinitomicaceae bacterium]
MLSLVDKEAMLQAQLGYVLEPALISEMAQLAKIRETTTDEIIVHVGDRLQLIPIVIEGSIKVSRENENGEELLLYYIEGGDTCAMSLQCCTKKIDSQIKATAMEPSLLLMIPAEFMEIWMDQYKSWRTYIISNYHTRMMELMESIDAIAFMNLDQRLLKYLRDQAKLLGSLEILHTHQQVADDLHSSRVVISRLLKQLEIKGEISLHRNKIILKTI